MSIRIMSRIWETGPHDQGELLTLLALADWANDDGRCWPSMRAIAEKVRVTERSAQRIVRRLEVSGWVEIETGGGRHGCNSYTINPDARVTVSDAETPTPASPRHKDGGDTGDIKPRHRRHKTPTPASPEPLRTTKEPSLSNAREILLSVLSEEVADDFIEHRKAKRAKLTDKAASLIAKKLAGVPNADAVVENSIMNGWTGVFPEKQRERRTETEADRMQRLARELENERNERANRLGYGTGEGHVVPLLSARRSD